MSNSLFMRVVRREFKPTVPSVSGLGIPTVLVRVEEQAVQMPAHHSHHLGSHDP